MTIRLAAAAICCSLAVSVAAADPAPPDMAARTELIAINTLTLSDAQFLTGDANAKAVTTAGQLRIPSGTGRLPVVVLQHGSGGMGANIEMWAREFNAMGISTFALDGFTGRGLTQVSTDQAQLGRLNFILDIYRGLDALAKHPRVDPQRIVLMGFRAAAKPRSMRASSASTAYGTSRASSSRPMCRSIRTAPRRSLPTLTWPTGRSASSAAPRTTTIRSCCASPTSTGSSAAGRNVQLTEYPNAPHSFDNPLGAARGGVAAVAERAQLPGPRRARRRAHQRGHQGAVRLPGRLRRARPAYRPRSRGDAPGERRREGAGAERVQETRMNGRRGSQ